MNENIRDLRERKQLSQDRVAEAAGLTYSQYVRIEEWNGGGRTTQEEYDHVLETLRGMEPGERKLAGRPFDDPEKQAAVEKARAEGRSVAEALGYVPPKTVDNTPLDDFTKKELLEIARGMPSVADEAKSRLSKGDLINLVLKGRKAEAEELV